MNRRQFIQHAGAFGAAAALGLPSVARADEAAPKPMPMIRIGSLAVSRLILGSNQYGGWAHRPGDAGKEMLAWYTDERVLAELDEAAALGINCVSIPPSDRWHRLWKTHKEKGGKMAFWIAQPAAAPDQMPADIEAAVKNGAKAVETIRQLEKPVIAYKILGAGRVGPKEGFDFALKNIRPKDGVCVGVWGKEGAGQLKEDAEMMKTMGG